MQEQQTALRRAKLRALLWASLLFGLALLLLLFPDSEAVTKSKPNEDETKPLPTIAEKTRDIHAMPGFFNTYWDARTGKVWLEINRFDSEFLFVVSLAAGIGSNDIGLDRGLFGDLDSTASP